MRNPTCQVLTILVTSWVLLWSTPSKALSLQIFDGIYEPSGIAQLSDGSILIVEDEGDEPLHLFSIGSEKAELILNAKPLKGTKLKVDDLEAIAKGENGDLFLITSHSATKDGSRKKKREKLIKTSLVNQQISSFGTTDLLTRSIQKQLESKLSLGEEELNRTNIEGMAFHPTGKKLLIGLRSPTHLGKALILTLMNPYDLIERGEKPKFSEEIISLDLEGAGVRAITYYEDQRKFLIAGETAGKQGKLRSRIWIWNGKANHQPVKLKLLKTKEAKNIEGITIASFEGSTYLLFVCDNGDKNKAQGANYGFIALKDYHPF
ncbi:MAG: DUF3616 domain-containing protein [Desulfobacterales bacterium]|nr:DUF3616 domain-containing protein [Desulfobacterales bacterium]